MKQTWLSSPFDGSSDKAVDGRFTSRSISDQQCTISQPNATITWWVNLGKVYMIDHIVMYFRTENLEWGNLSFIFKFDIKCNLGLFEYDVMLFVTKIQCNFRL